ncbi:coiled-coil domain-containing protein 17 [Stegastes partitus]|uniref:Coiled-coil domain-containing protein 17 n=1 Tax=Stegastes partitus TaxID=144197 RepID=A0A9Y4NIW6_9TELE|nr:PREDICTED: coiled-coil domain-containing protein 17 [Stegastes partitus]
MEKELICRDCNMLFRSARLLEKHKALFCIGSEAGHLWVQTHSSEPLRRNKAGGVDPKQTRTADLVQFHKLRRSIEENLPKWSKTTNDSKVGSTVSGSQLGHSERLKEMREMASVHERQLALIHAHNQQLEQQRDELAHQVSTLAEQSNTAHLESLLMELREQEDRNEETLQQLTEHLCALQALRQAYMQSGGSDPATVAQLIDLQAEAQSLEKNQPAAPSKARKKIAVKTELGLIQRENLHRISSIQAEMERRKEAYRPRRQPPPTPLPLRPKNHIHAPLSLFQTRSFSSPLEGYVLDSLDSLGPAPYDPAAGFVVFYDVLLGADASQKALRLVSALYSKGQEVGPPTPLPPVQCLPGVPRPYPHSLTPGNNVLLMQPSPCLALVVELQAATDLDVYNHEVFKLASCGWTRLELFDQYNQV